MAEVKVTLSEEMVKFLEGGDGMARTLTLERDDLRQEVIVLRKMGWEDEKIAEAVGVSPSIVRRWLSHNTTLANVGKRGTVTKNSKRGRLGKMRENKGQI